MGVMDVTGRKRIMSARILTVTGLVVAVLACGLTAADESAFHDCAICKPLMAEPGLLEHLRWQGHGIAMGMIAVTSVDPSHQQAYQRAHGKMLEAVKRLEAGDSMELCPFCQGMNALAQAGARIENVEAPGAHIMVITSDKPEVVARIHEHLRRANEMHAQHHGEHGHDHGHEGHAH